MLDIQTSSMLNRMFSRLAASQKNSGENMAEAEGGANLLGSVENVDDSFGDRVARLRQGKNLSQAELARRVGLTRSAINQIESGQTKASTPEAMFRLADELGVDPRELTFGEKTAAEAWDRAIFKLVDDLPERERQEVLDFTLYKIERSDHLAAGENAAKYHVMIERIRADMEKKKKGEG